MRALRRQSALTSPIALRLGPFLSRSAGEDEGRDYQIQSLIGQQWETASGGLPTAGIPKACVRKLPGMRH